MKPYKTNLTKNELVNALQAAEAQIAELTETKAGLERSLQDTAALYRISQFLIEFENVEDMLQRTVDSLADTLGFDRVNIITFDLEKQAVQNFYRGGKGKQHIVTVSFQELREGLSGWVLEAREPALSPKDIPDPRESLAVQRRRQETECGAIIVVPILFQGVILGTLTAINRPEQRDLTSRDVDMLMSLTGQLATMMENRRLFVATTTEVKERQRIQLELEKAYFDQERRIHKRTAELAEKNQALQQEISERQQIEEALRKSEQNFSKAFKSSPAALLITRLADGQYIELNDAYSEIVGYTRDELMGHRTTDFNIFIHSTDRQAIVKQLLETGSVHDFEVNIRHRSGEIRDVLAAQELTTFNGETCIMSIFLDITERKRAEQKLYESEKRYNLLFEKSTVPTVLLKLPEVVIINANEAGEKLTGLTRQEMFGKTAVELGLIKPEQRAQTISQFEQHGELIGHEIHLFTSSGKERIVIENTNQLEVGGHLYAISTFMDITERKQMEEELRRSNAELEQFAYVASHDLQEPLRAVAGMVQLLGQRYKGRLDENADEYIGHAVEASTRMQNLINDLLDYSRVGRVERSFERTSLEQALNTALANLQIPIQESQAQITRDPLPTLMADTGQMIQVLQNLIGNAIKFRGEGPLHIHIGAEKIDDTWRFSVSDNGIGIEPQYFARIFLVFQRLHTRRQYPGTGIGLSLCKKIIERHGGQIWVESQLGHGATFYFTLPEKKS